VIPNLPESNNHGSDVDGKQPGPGNGLAICRSIIEAHGGLLWATADSLHKFAKPMNTEARGLCPRHLLCFSRRPLS
jgi:hypothetical protein